jgi:hypothetical protein
VGGDPSNYCPRFGAIIRRKRIVMATFRKREDCPASQRLLAYQLGDTEGKESRAIGRHLKACDFCAAEVEFYGRYPLAEEADEMPESVSMPKPLQDLAEALLNKRMASSSMERILNELESSAERSR